MNRPKRIGRWFRGDPCHGCGDRVWIPGRAQPYLGFALNHAGIPWPKAWHSRCIVSWMLGQDEYKDSLCLAELQATAQKQETTATQEVPVYG